MTQQAQFTKWTTQQDQQLLKAVQKCGVQWKQVYLEIGKVRSQNSIIKRWHGHLKQTVDLNVFWKNTHLDSKGIPRQNKQLIQQPRRRRIDKKQKQKQPSRSEQDDISQKQEEDQEVNSGQNSQDNLKHEKINDETIKNMTNQDYIWKKKWTQQQDTKFRNYVVQYHILDWQKTSKLLSTTPQELKYRWYKVVFPKMRNTVKIGGSVKWCGNEDSILFGAHKKQVPFVDLMFYLPGRTIYSMQARWRRISKNYDLNDSGIQLQTPKTNSKNRNQILSQIAIMRRMKKRQAMHQIIKRQKQAIQFQRKQFQKYKNLQRQQKLRK